ncbi:A disintegrin and metalloproteinase with thrombospondin motifs 7 isoform X2 [Betta splendens]|uniref:A disintegrin and metalloproteinase with thrombospondin motifs 7 isoform X2 n=1 Tax=Betta splendens TaxID=158456 RepID=A0A6P7LYQ6_BETSP|nr:A disintegrin and metalloproteinase with thrombospondin motifs 7 isoform X2 [Betta splendens]
MARPSCGRCASQRGLPPIHAVVALLAALGSCAALATSRAPGTFLQDLPEYEVVHPTRVDAKGRFLSHFLSHTARRVQRREAAREPDSDRVFYQLWHRGRRLHFDLTLNRRLLAPGFLTETRSGGLDRARLRPPASALCHFLGEVWDEAAVKGSAAMSTCDGLTGLFGFSGQEFFIQPLEQWSDAGSGSPAHAVYRRHVSPPAWNPLLQPTSGKRAVNGTCGVKGSHQAFEDERERWERRQRRRRKRLRQRSVSREKWVETLVVADPKMVQHHGSKAVERYVLAVMNIVAGLYQDPSIGNAINIVVVRLVLLEKDEDDLKITHHADNSLNSFCKWQKKLNTKGDEHPVHHDVAVLLTRKDICSAVNAPCETLGLSHVEGMCQPHRSCSISEDTGLPLAFTVAHELGHNFGIPHDGNGNDCEPIGKHPFIMSPQLLYGTSLPRWSRCSRRYITRFLDRGFGSCLDDAPAKDKLSLNAALPGVLYSATHQCRLQYGSGSLLCGDVDDVCRTLWCTVGATCHSKLDGAVDGTGCGENKWCFGGECVALGFHPPRVDGGWASWSEWSTCSRTCGGGIESARRECDSPVPRFRGKYCLGERQRHRTCRTAPCPHQRPSFRDLQCSEFDARPYKGRFYTWEAVISKVHPCELHCRPLNERFSEKMRDAVIDGTPCDDASAGRDVCISGVCKNIGCDHVIDSTAVEDRCGVCHGNGSTCTTVRRTFEDRDGLGYVDIGLIPGGAWDIRIEEVAEAGNYLALRSDNADRYFLNGGWTIQWSGEYRAAGAVFSYVRTGHLENLVSPGPTVEPLWIQLLFQEKNPGVRYEYTINRNAAEDDEASALFFWKYGSWTECSVSCGAGVQRQIVHCVEKTTGMVEETHCDPLTRPAENQTRCDRDPCPALWWVGEWQRCSASCGAAGVAVRTVLCVRALSVDEQRTLTPSDCGHVPRPEALSSCNTQVRCPSDWAAGGWSKCSLSCGGGVRRRNVTCSRNTGVDCDPQKKPPALSACQLHRCPALLDNFGDMDISGSGFSSTEVLNEINSIPEAKPPKHSRAQPLNPNYAHHSAEADVHNNKIENVDRVVQVDDFYYDYNFIDFHEDLSDDFGSDGGDALSFNASQEESPTNSVKGNVATETGAPTASSKPTLRSEETRRRNLDSAEESSEDDFLSEDFLLPVSSSAPPPSTTQHPQGPDRREARRPESTSTAPLFSTKEPSRDARTGQHGDSLTEEDDVRAAPQHQTTINPVAQTAAGMDEQSALGPDAFTNQDVVESPEPEVQLDGSVSEIPQSTTGSTQLPEALNLDPVASHQTLLLLSSNLDLSTTSLPASEESTRSHGSFQQISGMEEAAASASSDGTESRSPAQLEGDASPSASDPMLTEPGPGTDSTSQPAVGGSSSSFAGTPPGTAAPPPPPPPLWPVPVATTAAYWVAGSWSDCSTTCGLGAVWRTLSCSTGSDADCDPAERPAPAQQCYLRPCSVWKVGEWSKCSSNCEGGVKSRELHCTDMRDQRLLRPFHCRATSPRPQTRAPCNLQPCLQWYSSSWGQCSELCGGGEQQRIVTCPEDDRCDRALQPSNIQACNTQTCFQWLTGSWGQCSASCGAGVQHRLIKCVDTKAEADEDVDAAQCDQELRPESTQKCHIQECESTAGGVCLRDRLPVRLCQTLRWLRRCLQPTVRAQCCRSCSQRSRPSGASQR